MRAYARTAHDLLAVTRGVKCLSFRLGDGPLIGIFGVSGEDVAEAFREAVEVESVESPATKQRVI